MVNIRVLTLVIIASVIITGCNFHREEKNGETLAEAIFNTPTSTYVEPSITPLPSMEPSPVLLPSPSPTPTLVPPTPVLEKGKNLDFEALNRLDGSARGWGVVLNNNHSTPEVPASIRNLVAKYDGFYVGDTSRKKVYIIFSASSEGGYTNRILDTLRDNNVNSVFFLVGSYVKANPQLVRRMLDEGHHVGNHSMTHPSLPKVGNTKLQEEMLSFEKYMSKEFNASVKYFMPPSGEYSEKVMGAAKQLGYKTIFWSFAYVDFYPDKHNGADYAYNMVMNNLHNGAFIFLHTISRDNAEALDRILKDIKAQGYDIGPFDI